ncbi:hypothetical protein ACO2Q8_08540 [Larkinella sp. VNQ87]|uniref:hypothetical protein n=1 Tax=Larkinella sp. VNQ87 TaxID=3400921 RepID=UPI003BFAC6B6
MKAPGYGIIALLTVAASFCHGQCIVSQDQQQRIVTICQSYVPPNGLLINRPDRQQAKTQTVFLGSEYLTYPVWQDGTLEFDGQTRSIACRLAFNLMTNQILCQFPGDSVVREIWPDAFTINAMPFVSQIDRQGKRSYFQVVYNGKTRLLAHYSCRFRREEREPYSPELLFSGRYEQRQRFFIQRDDRSLQRVTLSRKSLLQVLPDQSGKLPGYLTKSKLDLQELVDALAYYDGFH